MLGIILAILGITSILLGFFYFEKKTIWVIIGAALIASGTYFLFFTAPTNGANDTNEPIIGIGPKPVEFIQPQTKQSTAYARGIVINYYGCDVEKTCINLIDEVLGEIKITVDSEVSLENAMKIEAFCTIEDDKFYADKVIILEYFGDEQ